MQNRFIKTLVFKIHFTPSSNILLYLYGRTHKLRRKYRLFFETFDYINQSFTVCRTLGKWLRS